MPPRLLVPRVLPAALSVRPKPPRVALIHPQGMRSRLPNLGDYLSCFIQAPPNEFKEHKRTVVFSAVLTGQSWGQSCSGLQSSVTQTALRRSAKAPLPLDTDHSHPTARSSSPNKTSACHSPNHLQADHRGGGHTNMPETPTLPTNVSPRTKRRHVTHPTTCKQTIGEEGTPTCPRKTASRERQSATPATTAPLPERQQHNLIQGPDRNIVRVNSLHAPELTAETTLPGKPNGLLPGTAERSTLPPQMRTGTTL
jgi:hypothetical protein